MNEQTKIEDAVSPSLSTAGLGIKTFKFKHLFLSSGAELTCTEMDMPLWLTGKENKWFLERHVLTLNTGESVDADFQRITRVT